MREGILITQFIKVSAIIVTILFILESAVQEKVIIDINRLRERPIFIYERVP